MKGGITKHGLAINVVNDLAPFEWAVACGLPGVTMTSVEREAASLRSDPMGCLRKDLAHRVAEELGLRQRIVSPARLARALDDFVHPGLTASVSEHRLPITGGRCRRCCSPGAWPSSSRGRS